MMHMPLLDPATGRWAGDWSERAVEPYTAPTLYSLRGGARYHVVSDAQLKRDLKPRTIADVYRDNRAGRSDVPRIERYVPKHEVLTWDSGKREYVTEVRGGLGGVASSWNVSPHYKRRMSIAEEYLAWCTERGHTPHTASLDRSHPLHGSQIERCPKPEKVETAA